MVLVGYWPLDEASGNAVDYSGNNNGVPNADVSQGVDGILSGNAYGFDGVGSKVDLSDSVFSGSANRSIACWYKNGGSTSSVQSVYDQSRDGLSTGSAWEQAIRSNGNIRVSTEGSGRTWEASLYDGDYHLIVITLGGYKVADLKCYVDGKELSVVSTSDSTLNTVDETGAIGYRPRGNDQYLHGKLQHFRIYDHALTKQEVQYLYQVGNRGLHTSSKRTL